MSRALHVLDIHRRAEALQPRDKEEIGIRKEVLHLCAELLKDIAQHEKQSPNVPFCRSMLHERESRLILGPYVLHHLDAKETELSRIAAQLLDFISSSH